MACGVDLAGHLVRKARERAAFRGELVALLRRNNRACDPDVTELAAECLEATAVRDAGRVSVGGG